MSHHDEEDDQLANRLDWPLWRKVLTYGRPYKRDLSILSIAAIACAACDVALPYLTGKLIDDITTRGESARIALFGSLYVATIAILAINIYAFIILAGRVTTGVSHDIRRDCFAKLQALPFSFYDQKAVGWLMARLTSDCNNLSRVLGWALLDIVWGTFLLSALTVTMFTLSWKLALVVLCIIPLLLWVSRCFQVWLLLTSRKLRKANSHTTAAFNEGIVGVRTTKSLVREQRNLEEFTDLTKTMYRHAVDNALYSAVFLPLILTLCSLGVGLALWRGGVHVSVGVLSLGTLVTFIQYAAFLQNPAQELANTFTLIQAAQASAERVQGLLNTPITIKDSDEVLARAAAHQLPPTPSRWHGQGPLPVASNQLATDGLPDRIDTIEFRDVTFSYKPNQPVLKHFNLTVLPGQTIALVGPTGGGKSTIVSLLCRFYEPTSGRILIDNTDYRDRPLHWLQSNLGIVLQQPHLFSGTIRENIRYGRLNATDAEIEHAAQLTNAHDFIAGLPKQYDTPVGEGGARLSTGQKQLVSLARAVLADPRIFVMDEATSSVDTQTERAIQDAIDRVLEGRISFVIAHRLSTIKSADRILYIEHGEIAESGDHHELIRRRGKYFELYTNQFTQEHEEQLLTSTVAAHGAT